MRNLTASTKIDTSHSIIGKSVMVKHDKTVEGLKKSLAIEIAKEINTLSK